MLLNRFMRLALQRQSRQHVRALNSSAVLLRAAMELCESVLAGLERCHVISHHWLKCDEGHLSNREADRLRRSRDWWQKRLLLMVLAQNISHAVPTTPSAPQAGTAKGCPSPPLPREDHASPLCHSPTFAARPRALPCHFTFKGERGGRNVHCRW